MSPTEGGHSCPPSKKHTKHHRKKAVSCWIQRAYNNTSKQDACSTLGAVCLPPRLRVRHVFVVLFPEHEQDARAPLHAVGSFPCVRCVRWLKSRLPLRRLPLDPIRENSCPSRLKKPFALKPSYPQIAPDLRRFYETLFIPHPRQASKMLAPHLEPFAFLRISASPRETCVWCSFSRRRARCPPSVLSITHFSSHPVGFGERIHS